MNKTKILIPFRTFESEVEFLYLSIDFSCHLRYALSDGQAREETGILSQVGETKIFRVAGSYTFKGTDGKTYVVQYSADENGYVADVTTEESESLFEDRISNSVVKTLLGG